jgi:FkbM family methyltransferase
MLDDNRKFRAKRPIQSFLKGLTPPLLWDLPRRLKKRRRKFYGLNGIDKRLAELLPHRDGYFVELGANDGISQSNTLYFERERNWRGVLVEPVPHNYLRCRANRSSRTRVFCNACTSFDYEGRFVEIAYSNLMSSPLGLESDVPEPVEHAREGKQYLDAAEEVFTFGAIARPLNDLLIEAEAPAMIDLLSLDVEGAEIAVLKGIDHTRFRFKYLCIESRGRAKLEDYLRQNGYEFFEQLTHHDYLFADRSNQPRK